MRKVSKKYHYANATENTIDIDQAGDETVKREQYSNVSHVQLLFFLIFVLVMGNIYFLI